MLSLIIPCYNEGIKLIKNIDLIKDYLTENNIIDYEIIVVNDGSKDNTLKILNEIIKENCDIKLVSYEKNQGKGHAVKKGIEKSIGDFIIFMDADLSTNLSAINNVLEEMNNYDVIIGSRRHKSSVLVKPQNFTRRFIGNTCSLLTNLIIPLKISDTQCGFKAFNGNFAREMIKKQQLNGFAFDVEYLYMAKLNKQTILEIPIVWENDEDSKVSVVKSSIIFFKDLFRIRKNKLIYKEI